MVADERLCVLGCGVSDEGSDTGPGGEDVLTSDLDVLGEVVSDLSQDPLDLLLLWNRVCVYRGGRVGRTGDGVALPRQEEDDSTIRGGWVKHTHRLGRVVVGESDVDTRRGCNDGLDRRVIELAHAIREGTGGVDDALQMVV